MANATTPTAANIISSLGVRGAISRVPAGASASAFAGFVPMLGPDGRLNARFIPDAAAQMAISPLTSVAFVDPDTEVEESMRRGSVVAPFKTLGEVSAYFTFSGDSLAVVLASGDYNSQDDQQMAFPIDFCPKCLYLIGLGECRLKGPLGVRGLSDDGARLVLKDIMAEGNVSVANCAEVACVGCTSVMGTLALPSGAVLRMSPEAYVGQSNAAQTVPLAAASGIRNDSNVGGVAVSSALDTLESRSIRVADVKPDDEHGVVVDGLDQYLIAEGEVYDLSEHDKKFVSGIQKLAARLDNPTVGALTADTVSASAVNTSQMSASSLTLGDQVVYIDSDGFLVVGGEPPAPGSSSGSSSSSPGPGPVGSSSDSSSDSSSSSAGSSSSSALSCECVQVDFMDASAGHMVHEQACGDWGETVTFHTDHDGWLSVFRSWDDRGWVVTSHSADITSVSMTCADDGSDSAS